MSSQDRHISSAEVLEASQVFGAHPCPVITQGLAEFLLQITGQPELSLKRQDSVTMSYPQI